jgi:hypothetical protein
MSLLYFYINYPVDDDMKAGQYIVLNNAIHTLVNQLIMAGEIFRQGKESFIEYIADDENLRRLFGPDGNFDEARKMIEDVMRVCDLVAGAGGPMCRHPQNA